MCFIVTVSAKYSRPAPSSHLHDSKSSTTSDNFNADKDKEKDERTAEECQGVGLAQLFLA
jgi:hypothetical protein